MTPLEKFLHDVHEIHSSHAGVDETSYYGSLETLFNEIGHGLKPRVRCIIHIQNRGAGLPDGGFFTADQFEKKSAHEPKRGQPPSRGAVEVKSPREDATHLALSEQVTRYLSRYRQVLATNLRQFVLIGHDLGGNAAILEKYEIAGSEAAFWKASAHPRRTDEAHGGRLAEYLKRVMLHAAPIASPEDVAFFLASYARDAMARTEGVELDALAAVRTALEEALGLKFEGKRGEHFFHSSLIQTLFYGVFSAWVLWARQRPPTAKDRFRWAETARLLRVPVIRKLFHEVADPGQLEALNLAEVLDWTAAVLNRVDRAQFFSKFQESAAVQYFYEPFLEEFDPELRKQLGVWYTPHEIVKYMVGRVDTVLREELNLPDGLADKNVYVLDPCCGTGSYLVEVLKKIHETLERRGNDALIAADLKEAAQNRVFGFEILPAPFVVSHLQLGLLLQNFGAPLAEKSNERIGVYLTNALTGWEPPKGPKQHLIFSELEQERDAAEHVKRDTPILVILGNPPYNGFAGVAIEEERTLTNAYRTTKKAPPPQGQGLNDLYVRFYRMAERRIAEMSGYGIVCLISNYSWLDGLSFTGMRESYLEKFDRIWIDCLNGDKYKTGKLTPEGEPDPSVFSTDWNREGIQVGTAIGLLARKREHTQTDSIRFRHFWGKTKRHLLLESLAEPTYADVTPGVDLGFPFIPAKVGKGYGSWPLLTELFPHFFPGVKTSRDRFLTDFDKAVLAERMQAFFDPGTSYTDWQAQNPGLVEKSDRFDPEPTRQYLVRRGFKAENIVRYQYRPFDARWLYWEPETDLLDRKREDYFPHICASNLWIEARQKQTMEDFDRGLTTRLLADNFGNGLSSFFPLTLKSSELHGGLIRPSKTEAGTPNIGESGESYLAATGCKNDALFLHAVSILNDPAYRAENAGALRQDWPRVPLPDSEKLLLASAELGRKVAVLFETESTVKGITSGEIRSELRYVGVITRAGAGSLKESDLALTAGWGHAGKGGVTMPGKGKLIERDYAAAERKALQEGATALDLSDKQLFDQLGRTTCDVYLNDTAYWSNIPLRVWDYIIGGYQVIKKWLSYREQKILGRALTKDEVRYVQEMARRIAAILLMEPELDANYEAIKANSFRWNGLVHDNVGGSPNAS
ncbi:MAG: type ISP restriction/modification enzyme [Candidatus Acidiferrales bacterium]